MKNFEDKVVKVISKLTCDRCCEEAIPSDYEFNEFISLNHKCGYGSIHSDGNQIKLISANSVSLICVVIV